MNAFRDYLNKRDRWGWPRWMFGVSVVLGLALYYLLWPIFQQFGWPFWAKLFALAACGASVGWVVTRFLGHFRRPSSDEGI